MPTVTGAYPEALRGGPKAGWQQVERPLPPDLAVLEVQVLQEGDSDGVLYVVVTFPVAPVDHGEATLDLCAGPRIDGTLDVAGEGSQLDIRQALAAFLVQFVRHVRERLSQLIEKLRVVHGRTVSLDEPARRH